VDVRGEILELKDTINHLVDQLKRLRRRGNARRARGRPLKASSAARRWCAAVAGTWKDLTDSVNSMASNLTGQVATSPRSVGCRARRPVEEDHRERDGEILRLKKR